MICAECSNTVGCVDLQTQAFSLRKLHLAMSSHPNKPSTSYDSSKWLACLLLRAVETDGTRKFTVYSGDYRPGAAIKLWVFTPDLTVSTTARSSAEPVRVAKVLWKEVGSTVVVDDRLNATGLAEGQLQLQKDEFTALKDALEGCHQMLPEATRKFQDWHVTLLERFTGNDLASFYCSF